MLHNSTLHRSASEFPEPSTPRKAPNRQRLPSPPGRPPESDIIPKLARAYVCVRWSSSSDRSSISLPVGTASFYANRTETPVRCPTTTLRPPMKIHASLHSFSSTRSLLCVCVCVVCEWVGVSRLSDFFSRSIPPRARIDEAHEIKIRVMLLAISSLFVRMGFFNQLSRAPARWYFRMRVLFYGGVSGYLDCYRGIFTAL